MPFIIAPRRVLMVASVALVLTATGSSLAKAGAAITLDYDFVETEVSPQQEVHRSHETHVYHLSGRNALSFRDSRGNDRQVDLGRDTEFRTANGEEGLKTVHVVAGAIQMTNEFQGRNVVTTISAHGLSSCSAAQKYLKKPGHRFFETTRISNGEHMFESDEHVENLRCTISVTPD